ncbi:MAG: AtpZ/AtpI family protein [Actinomycetota bacterium]|nr:AtpZ/AtpI family protein [Actinomycetota bacterium]
MSKTRSFVRFMVKGNRPSASSGEQNRVDGPGQFGEGVVKAFEVVLTPILFALIGLAIDYEFNTTPLFTLGFLFFGIAGMTIKLWFVSFGPQSSPQFLQSGDSSSRVVRRSQITPVVTGELLGGDLDVPKDLDLTFDRGSEPRKGDN